MKVMFIDDNPDSVADAMETLEDEFETTELWLENFERGKSNIGKSRPDILVLDVWDGKAQESDPSGFGIMNDIWDRHFCPVIIYSADSKIISDVPQFNHPFIKIISKGRGSDVEVLRAVEELSLHVESLKSVARIVSDSLSTAMKMVAPYAFEQFQDLEGRLDVLARAGRRRVAAMMDEPIPGATSLASWEHYIFPPVSKDLKLGDILKLCDGRDLTATSYRLVLSPSCDMVASCGRPPKVSEILVAKCCTLGEALSKINLTIGKKYKDLSSTPLLSQGYFNSIVPFPSLPGKIPAMAADLRDLSLVPFPELMAPNPKYFRLASIDSPFRESISWAYVQIAGRPGMPDRDLASWSREINEEAKFED